MRLLLASYKTKTDMFEILFILIIKSKAVIKLIYINSSLST